MNMKVLILTLFILSTSASINIAPCLARPLHYFITGAVFVMTGGIFNSKYELADDAANYSKNKAAEKLQKYDADTREAARYRQEATVEESRFGNTLDVDRLNTLARLSEQSATRNLTMYNGFSVDSHDSQNQAQMYRVVSLTSLSIGGVLILKGVIDWYAERHQRSAWVRAAQKVGIDTDQEVRSVKVKVTQKFEDLWVPWNSRESQ